MSTPQAAATERHLDDRHWRSLWLGVGVLFSSVVLAWPSVSQADLPQGFQRIPPQFIATLAGPDETQGTGAETWGLWDSDPGPTGVWLHLYPMLKAAGGYAPGNWLFDDEDWWLDENGLLMEQPEFPMPPGDYLVTGEREVTSVLTVHPADADGKQAWSLADLATIHDVTHLACRSARYTPKSPGGECSPAAVDRSLFKIAPDDPMPVVAGCDHQDYSVLIVIGVPTES